MIPTGGTSGKIKFAIHSWQSLTASVKGFTKYLNQETINSFCILPLYHVSGLMQFLRSFLTGGKLTITSYKNLKKDINNFSKTEDFFISLVPTQLKYFLDNQPQWLAKFAVVLVGGAATPKLLLDQARINNINIALTYGMTETASGITILKPDDFLVNNNSNGQLLPHAKIIIEQKKEPQNLLNNVGILKIESESLFQGYYPHQLKENNHFITDDIGYIDKHGYLYILGRNSRKIITGGENVFPKEIEAVILATNLVKDIYILGENDIKWGEIIVAFYVPKNEHILEEDIKEAIALKLSKYKIPKHWYQVSHIPRNSQGKINLKLLAKYYQK
jgi:O-succinylbenzoic acid--CoA ligase